MVFLRKDSGRRSHASAGLVARSAALGVAAGARSSLGLAAPAMLAPGRRLNTAAGVASLGIELVGDKLPGTPSRLKPAGLGARLVGGVGGALALAKRDQAARAWPALAGLLGAAGGAWAGNAWRRWAGPRMGDRNAAFLEDGAALTLAVVACLPMRRPDGE